MRKNTLEKKINYKLNFFLLVSGQLVSVLGSSMFNFALSLYVLDTVGSAAAFSTVLVAGILPKIFVNFFAGVFVDRHSKKLILVFSDLLSGLSVVIFMLLMNFYKGSLFLIIGCTLFLAFFSAFFQLASMASIPSIVREESVMKANSLMQSILAVTGIVGPVLGALAYSTFSIGFVFMLNGISYMVSGLSEAYLRYRPSANEKKIGAAESYLGEIREGLKYINGRQIIKFLIIFMFFIQVIGVPLITMILPYITYKILKVSSVQLSVMEASWAVGMVIGSIIVARQKSPNKLLKKFFVLLALQGILVMTCFFPSLPLFSGASNWTISIVFSLIVVVIIMLNIMQSAPLLSYFQLDVPEEIRGRVFGVFNTVLLVAPPIGMWIYGLVMNKVNWALIPVVSGFLILVFCIYANYNKHFKEFIVKLED